MATLKSLQAKKAELKEARSQKMLEFANDDDITTGANHPDVKELERQINEVHAAISQLQDDGR